MRRMSDQQIQARLSELGLELPPPPRAVASYVPVRVSGKLAFVAGQVPMLDGVVMHAGRIGEPSDGGGEVASVTAEQGAEAARQGALQALSALREALGSLDQLAGIVQVTVYVSGVPDFAGHPTVANGASDLLVELLGESGRHARAAVGVASLPLGAAVEVVVTAELA